MIAWTALLATCAHSVQEDARPPFPELRGPYLGQAPPGDRAEVFAAGIVTTDVMSHSSPSFTPDGLEVYWSEFGQGERHDTILWSRQVEGQWTRPEPVSFTSTEGYGDDVPFVAPDGRRLYFCSFRALPELGLTDREKIWWVERTDSGWSEARPVAAAVNSGQMHWQVSVSARGTLFYGTDEGMRLSRLVDGEHQPPEEVTQALHPAYTGTTPFIAPDESYLMFASEREGGLGKHDLYVGFRRPDGTWAAPARLGPQVNSDRQELCPMVSPDGEYLFFLSQRGRRDSGVFWIRADFLESLRPAEPGAAGAGG
jgi:Tol biopolymer transport system component